MNDQKKLKRETDLDRVNKLIDWNEKNRPDAGQVIQLSVTPERLARMLGRGAPVKDGKVQPFPRQQPHRNRMLEAVG